MEDCSLISRDFDVIVVGLGPAGLSACIELAKSGIKVLGLDRKQEIGVPKRCAEGLSLNWFKRLKLKPEKDFAVQKIFGARLYSPSGKSITLKAKTLQGFVLERKAFEKKLALQAAKQGALLRVKSQVENAERISVNSESKSGKANESSSESKASKAGESKVKLTVKEFDQTKIYFAPLIIACDGVDSRTARFLGLNTVNKLNDIDSGFQYEMTGIKGFDESLLHLYFGNEISPRGYAWVFGKRKNTANVGIGIAGYCEKTAKHYLDKFIAMHPEMFASASVIEANAGAIPVGGFLEKMHASNLLVCGDAAHQVDPIHGGGIGIAMEAGALAAKTAIQALKRKDFSEEMLEKYTVEWYKVRGNQLKKRLKARHLLEKLSDEDFEYLAGSLNFDEIMAIGYGEVDKKAKWSFIAKKLVKRPKLLAIMMKYLKS